MFMQSRTFQYYATFAASLTTLSSGIHYAWASEAIPELIAGTRNLQITKYEASWLIEMYMIGKIFGGFFASAILNYIGQRKSILAGVVPHIGGWLAIAYGKHVAILCVARFIVGFMNSLTYVGVTMYIGEIADPDIRGLLGTRLVVSITSGQLIANVIGLYASVHNAALLLLFCPLFAFSCCLWIPESPYFLIVKGNDREALNTLRLLRKKEMIRTEYDKLKEAIVEEMKNKVGYLDLLRVPYYRNSLFILIILRVLPPLVGCTAMVNYSSIIFKEVEGSISHKTLIIMLYTTKPVMNIFASFIVDKIGRKPLLLFSAIGTALSLLTVAIFCLLEKEGIVTIAQSSYIPITALFAYIICFNTGLGSIAFMMQMELMALRVKSQSLCVVDMSFAFVGTLTSQYFQITNDLYGLGVPFMSFAFCALLSVGFIVFFVPETKGKSLEEIQEDLKIASKQN